MINKIEVKGDKNYELRRLVISGQWLVKEFS